MVTAVGVAPPQVVKGPLSSGHVALNAEVVLCAVDEAAGDAGGRVIQYPDIGVGPDGSEVDAGRACE